MNKVVKRDSFLVIRNLPPIKIPGDKVKKLEDALLKSDVRFIKVGGNIHNIADIKGVYDFETVDSFNHPSMHKCEGCGKWLKRGEFCQGCLYKIDNK